MLWLAGCLLPVSLIAMLALAAWPRRSANRRPQLVGRFVAALSGLAFLGAASAGVAVATQGPLEVTGGEWSDPIPVCVGLRLDAVSLLMAGLILMTLPGGSGFRLVMK